MLIYRTPVLATQPHKPAQTESRKWIPEEARSRSCLWPRKDHSYVSVRLSAHLCRPSKEARLPVGSHMPRSTRGLALTRDESGVQATDPPLPVRPGHTISIWSHKNGMCS